LGIGKDPRKEATMNDQVEEYCKDCENGTDMPCAACIREDEDKAWGISK
jgi:hypothetical protein